MKKNVLSVIVLFSAVLIAGCTPNYLNQNSSMNNSQDSGSDTTSDTSKNDKYSEAPAVLSAAELKNKKVVMVTDKGTFEFELYGETAPITVSNFIFLVKDKFYDGLSFHRVERSLNIIQGGDPLGTGTGGPGYTIEEEPPTSGSEYKEGIVAMAKTAAPHSTGSQFFIMTEDFDGFSPDYSIFGKVISGIDVVKSIEVGDVMTEVRVEDLK